MKRITIITSFSAIMGTVVTSAAPAEKAARAEMATICEVTMAPFPNAVCEPFTTSDDTVVAVFRLDPSKAKKGNFNVMKTVRDINSDATIWVPNEKVKSGHEDFCDNANGLQSGHINPYMPLVSDCLVIKEWAASNAGHWAVSKADLDKHRWTALSVVNTCAFVIGATKENRPNAGINIGNQDVTEIIQQAI
ncbi:hypothetical protein CORC01_08601 [Colletotrichum orchidophilum]|uniref:Ecp2 effector protein-like domain-containing protein n=1 Tax=Colletotrichum orchidophilum TaxID=1209926 RepID=A0A1G4B3U6_9PEZI|nr:uncharacterized protein CORC01_08601 [Colletotrichum orchidophilum]OHE96064.1 hypothetical protein CORC01_08601 [Colletotrichum orchidophilum]